MFLTLKLLALQKNPCVLSNLSAMVVRSLPGCRSNAITTQNCLPPLPSVDLLTPRLNRSGGSESFTLLSRVILNWVCRWRCACCETYVAAEWKGTAGWMRNVTATSPEKPTEDNLSCSISVWCSWIEHFENDFVWTWSQKEHLSGASCPALILPPSQWCAGASGSLPSSSEKTTSGLWDFPHRWPKPLLLLSFLHSILPSAYRCFSFFSPFTRLLPTPSLLHAGDRNASSLCSRSWGGLSLE